MGEISLVTSRIIDNFFREVLKRFFKKWINVKNNIIFSETHTHIYMWKGGGGEQGGGDF